MERKGKLGLILSVAGIIDLPMKTRALHRESRGDSVEAEEL